MQVARQPQHQHQHQHVVQDKYASNIANQTTIEYMRMVQMCDNVNGMVQTHDNANAIEEWEMRMK